MIRPLRRAHLAVSIALAVVLPVGLVLALGARVVWPIEASADAPPESLAVPGSEPAWSASWDELAIGLRLWRAGADGRALLELAPTVDLARPDVLVYWQRGAPAAPEAGALNGNLLGTLAGVRTRTFALPQMANESDGHLILYSLGHQEVISTLPLAAVGVR